MAGTSQDPKKFHDYDGFVEKFKPKRTTDDCYTPANIYEVVASYVERQYNLDRKNFVRPFYPGGDYEHYDYPEGCVVVDNPPFSILSKILKFYQEHEIRFFLFASTLTLFSSAASSYASCLVVGAQITYDNGANVNTSFFTNLEPEDIRARTAPDLYAALSEANKVNERELHKEVAKYTYPKYVVTAALMGKWCKYGIDYTIYKHNSRRITTIDELAKLKKTGGKSGGEIYGKGYLLSERAAAERAAAERAAAERAAAERAAATALHLSEREMAIVEELGKDD